MSRRGAHNLLALHLALHLALALVLALHLALAPWPGYQHLKGQGASGAACGVTLRQAYCRV